MSPELTHNLLGSKVYWKIHGNDLRGVIHGIYFEERNGGGAWNWTLLVRITYAYGFGAASYPVNTITEVSLGRVAFYD